MKSFHRYLTTIILLVFFALPAAGEVQSKRFEAADSEGVIASRDSTALYLQVDANIKSPIKIPRLAAPLRSMIWQGSITDDGLSLKPEQDHWVINWKNKPAKNATLMIQFGDVPLLLDEVKPIKKSTDGSFYLPAHKAFTAGEKIRYEPQPHKNTVGYWTGKKDSATWTFDLKEPGQFNIAILQGCGKGQGGSAAAIRFRHTSANVIDEMLSYTVKETGHFQNFQWSHAGEIELSSPGVIEIMIGPGQIKKAALMDIRAIHLIRLPDKK